EARDRDRPDRGDSPCRDRRDPSLRFARNDTRPTIRFPSTSPAPPVSFRRAFATGAVRGGMATMQNRRAIISTTLLEDVGPLRDRDLWLELRVREPENPARGWVPAYRFAMRLDGVEHAVGRL